MYSNTHIPDVARKTEEQNKQAGSLLADRLAIGIEEVSRQNERLSFKLKDGSKLNLDKESRWTNEQVAEYLEILKTHYPSIEPAEIVYSRDEVNNSDKWKIVDTYIKPEKSIANTLASKIEEAFELELENETPASTEVEESPAEHPLAVAARNGSLTDSITVDKLPKRYRELAELELDSGVTYGAHLAKIVGQQLNPNHPVTEAEVELLDQYDQKKAARMANPVARQVGDRETSVNQLGLFQKFKNWIRELNSITDNLYPAEATQEKAPEAQQEARVVDEVSIEGDLPAAVGPDYGNASHIDFKSGKLVYEATQNAATKPVDAVVEKQKVLKFEQKSREGVFSVVGKKIKTALTKSLVAKQAPTEKLSEEATPVISKVDASPDVTSASILEEQAPAPEAEVSAEDEKVLADTKIVKFEPVEIPDNAPEVRKQRSPVRAAAASIAAAAVIAVSLIPDKISNFVDNLRGAASDSKPNPVFVDNSVILPANPATPVDLVQEMIDQRVASLTESFSTAYDEKVAVHVAKRLGIEYSDLLRYKVLSEDGKVKIDAAFNYYDKLVQAVDNMLDDDKSSLDYLRAELGTRSYTLRLLREAVNLPEDAEARNAMTHQITNFLIQYPNVNEELLQRQFANLEINNLNSPETLAQFLVNTRGFFRGVEEALKITPDELIAGVSMHPIHRQQYIDDMIRVYGSKGAWRSSTPTYPALDLLHDWREYGKRPGDEELVRIAGLLTDFYHDKFNAHPSVFVDIGGQIMHTAKVTEKQKIKQCADGTVKQRPNYTDSSWQPRIASGKLVSVDAQRQAYAVVPKNSDIPLGAIAEYVIELTDGTVIRDKLPVLERGPNNQHGEVSAFKVKEWGLELYDKNDPTKRVDGVDNNRVASLTIYYYSQGPGQERTLAINSDS